MKKTILFILCIFLTIYVRDITEEEQKPFVFEKEYLSEWDMLWLAIERIESNSNDSAKNERSTATGRYQLLDGYVHEANRILCYEEYVFDDRFDPIRSKEMIEIVQGHHNPRKDILRAARLHRIGFASDSKSLERYRDYVQKIESEMIKIRKEQ